MGKARRIGWCWMLAAALCAAGEARAQSVDEAIRLYERGDYAAALPGLRVGADQGNATAQFNLAMMYSNGRGVPKDGRIAVFWYTKVAEQGFTGAQFNLALMYANGQGIAKNEHLAVFWYTKAAEQGDGDAQYNLALMYANGRGVARNDSIAVHWYTKAAEQGDSAAQLNLGVHYDQGRGVPKDERMAVHWYTKAAEQGVLEAQFNLGLMYDYGESGTNDDRMAVFWYRRAAEQGLAPAQSELGKMYSSGRGVVKNEREAFLWRSAAAAQGNATAQAALGAMYALGVGVPKDEQTGYFWILLASAEGDDNARKFLSFLEDRITPQQRADAQAAARVWKPVSATTAAPTQAPPQTAPSSTGPDSTGTGFRIARDRFVTNHHVIEDCRRIRVDGTAAQIRASDARMDLALLSAPVSGPIASVRANRPLVGEAVTVAGFPLQGLLSGFQVTTGTLASLSGIGGDTSQFQITAPVQAGNSGGPVLDSAGRVMGVVVAKLNAIRTARVTGDLPQNVNFAVGGNALRSFLDATDVNYQTSLQDRPLQTTAVAQQAQGFTVRVECWK